MPGRSAAAGMPVECVSFSRAGGPEGGAFGRLIPARPGHRRGRRGEEEEAGGPYRPAPAPLAARPAPGLRPARIILLWSCRTPVSSLCISSTDLSRPSRPSAYSL